MCVVAVLRRMIALLLLLSLAVGCAGSHPAGGASARTEGQQQTSAHPAQQGLTDTGSRSETGGRPQSDEELASLDLTRDVPASIRRACRELATKSRRQGVHRTVFCPPIVPTARPQKVELAGGALRYRDLTDGYQVGLYTPGMAAVQGGHWTFAAGSAEALDVYLHLTGPIVNATVLGETRLASTPVTIYAMPADQPGFYAGHVIAAWQLDRTTYHLTIHGRRNRSRLKVMAEAMIIEIETCRTDAALATNSCRLVFKP